MKTPLLPTPDELSLPELMKRFDTEERALEYFEAIRWPDGPVCPHCSNAEQGTHWKISAAKRGTVRAGLWQCGACKKQFRVTVGTIFEGSHIGLHLWLVAWFIMSGAKKGVSALQMQRHLGLGSYRSAWFLCHRIRHAMQDPAFTNLLDGTVEVDETYVGGKPRPYVDESGKVRSKISPKTAVVSLVQRNGSKRSFVMEHVTARNLREAIFQNVADDSNVHTDEAMPYRGLSKTIYKHRMVNHSKGEYCRQEADGTVTTTNHAESSFSLLKRSIVGSFHHVSKKHLHRYVGETDFKWDHRKTTDGARTVEGLKKCAGKRLTYKPLTK
ncbi:MAG: IS1595 family transposase [Chthoniobacteraceae bacterium]